MASASRSLALVASGLLGFAAVYLLGGLNWLPWDLRPGSPVGQSLGIAAALILLSTLFYLPLRRSDGGRWGKPAAQALHGLAGTAGTALAIMHSQAALREWSTLVLLAVVGLLATGIYGRVVAPIRVGTTFGRSAIPYAAAARPHALPTTSDGLVTEKRRLLETIAAEAREGAREGTKEGTKEGAKEGAKEGEFVLRWHHWTRSPSKAWRYHRLAISERRALARNPLSASSEVSALERLWRRVHLGLAGLFIIGLLAHVVTTVFFAGYVADGREIYWWHLTRW